MVPFVGCRAVVVERGERVVELDRCAGAVSLGIRHCAVYDQLVELEGPGKV